MFPFPFSIYVQISSSIYLFIYFIIIMRTLVFDAYYPFKTKPYLAFNRTNVSCSNSTQIIIHVSLLSTIINLFNVLASVIYACYNNKRDIFKYFQLFNISTNSLLYLVCNAVRVFNRRVVHEFASLLIKILQLYIQVFFFICFPLMCINFEALSRK